MKDWFCLDNRIRGNKYFKWQFGHYNKDMENNNIFNIHMSWNRRQDHAGFNFTVEIWNLYSFFQIYDNRHWCYHCNKFEDQVCRDEYHQEYFE